MTEKLSAEEFERKKAYFDQNVADIRPRIAAAAARSGRTAQDIHFLAATKTVHPDVINYAISKGITYIGENRVQELLGKYDALHLDGVARHFIGHLQTNKVKMIIDKVDMIESVHSMKLAQTIGRLAVENNRVMDILLEVNIGSEESKSGFAPNEVEDAIRQIAQIDGVSVKGLMAIPPICARKSDAEKYFSQMQKLFIDIRDKNIDNSSMLYLSMGMSEDFDLAIEHGANIVRIGTALFGARVYR